MKKLQKQIKRIVILAVIFSMICSLCPNERNGIAIQAKKAKRVTKTVTLKADKNYYYDLDGDGKNEKIRHSYKEKMKNGEMYSTFTIMINGKVCYKKSGMADPDFGGVDVKLCNLNKKDKYAVLYFGTGSADDSRDGNLMRYKNKKLKQVVKNKQLLYGCIKSIKFKDNGTIRIKNSACYQPVIGCYIADITFKVVKNKLIPIKKNGYKIGLYDKKFSYISQKNLKVYEKASNKSKRKFTLKKGTKIKIDRIKTSNGNWGYGYLESNYTSIYLHIKTSKGKKGWVYISQKVQKKCAKYGTQGYIFKGDNDYGVLPAWG